MKDIKNNYKPRLIDKTIEMCKLIFGAILIEGPKQCGKTWTGINNSNSQIFLGDNSVFNFVSINQERIFDPNKYQLPLLIDEWQKLPSLWDDVRNHCDMLTTKGNYILTGSSNLIQTFKSGKIFHSGTGRITKLKMFTMSLYESGESNEFISIKDMINGNNVFEIIENPLTLEEIAKLIIRGGWPELLNISNERLFIFKNKDYINSVVSHDLKDFGFKSDRKMLMIIKSISRNESTLTTNQTILKDVEILSKNESERINSIKTLETYLDILRKLNLLIEDEAFSVNYRSSKKVGKTAKIHLVDPSLSCAALDLNSKKLIQDIRTFGFMFEALVIRDLRIYAQYLGGNIKHFRDNSSGMEIDAIMEFEDGYAAFEIKLGTGLLDEAKENLIKFYKNVEVKPKFMCIIFGICKYITYDKVNNIYIIPFNCLKPE